MIRQEELYPDWQQNRHSGISHRQFTAVIHPEAQNGWKHFDSEQTAYLLADYVSALAEFIVLNPGIEHWSLAMTFEYNHGTVGLADILRAMLALEDKIRELRITRALQGLPNADVVIRVWPPIETIV
jgi:hypothetical protein